MKKRSNVFRLSGLRRNSFTIDPYEPKVENVIVEANDWLYLCVDGVITENDLRNVKFFVVI